ncbi:MAG: hypothetical protein J0L75_04750 [Spirochaetes bacterium]|nr:hypothetical protein [Spirochaetota bacterium]
MAAGIRTWDGWKKLSEDEKAGALRVRGPESAPPAPPAPKADPYPKGLVPASMERIDTRAQAARLHEAAMAKLARLDTIGRPKLCALCGQDLGDARFVLYAPERTHICRGCRQSAKRCPHCMEVHKPGTLGKGDACEDCRARACTCCGAALGGEARRFEWRKGAYCPSCFEAGPRCTFCGLPTRDLLAGTPWPACVFCKPTGLPGIEKAVETADRVASFLRTLDRDFRLPDLPIFFQDPARPKTSPWHLEHGEIHLTASAPEVWFQRQVCDHLSGEAVSAWSKVKTPSPLKNALSRYFRMLWFEHDGHFVALEEEKRVGLRQFPEFQPLFQSWSRLGSVKATAHFHKLLA